MLLLLLLATTIRRLHISCFADTWTLFWCSSVLLKLANPNILCNMSYCKQSRNKICLQLSDENIPNTWKCGKHKRTLIEKAFCPGSGKGFQWRRMFTFVGRLSLSLSAAEQLDREGFTLEAVNWSHSEWPARRRCLPIDGCQDLLIFKIIMFSHWQLSTGIPVTSYY